jgi:hypothetical protein
LRWLLHDWVACSIASRADMLFDLRTFHAARPSFVVSQIQPLGLVHKPADRFKSATALP